MKLTLLPSRRGGFTLIELLVVVSIIALLAVGSVAGYQKVIKSVRTKEAQMICTHVAGAFTEYYNKYEGQPVDVAGEDTEVDTAESDIIAIFLAKGDVAKNPSKTVFLEGIRDAKKGAQGMWENGLDYETDPAKPKLIDPWGNPYKIKVDADLNREIENPSKDSTPKIIRDRKAIVWSAGPDKNWETWSDNVKTW